MTRQEELEAEGWTRMFARGGKILQRFVNLYGELGFEVHLEPMSKEDLPPQCEGCSLLGDCNEYQVIYVRPREKGADSQADSGSA